MEEKNGECKEDILPVCGKSKEASDLKEYLKCFRTRPVKII
jgi:hypothetical protein